MSHESAVGVLAVFGVLSITISPAGSQHEVHVLEVIMMHLECTFTVPLIYTGANYVLTDPIQVLSQRSWECSTTNELGVLSAYHHGHNADHITSSLQTDTIR